MNWRTPITMVVLLCVLLGAAYYGWQTIVNPGSDKTAAAHNGGRRCKHKVTIKKGQHVTSSEVVVNVYNIGSRGGLATETLDELVHRGFKRGIADNARGNLTSWPNATVVLPRGQAGPQTRLVHNQFLGIVKYHRGPALAPGVDILVGDGFRGVDKSAHSFVRVNRRVDTCVAKKTAG